MTYREPDLSRLRTVPVGGRANKVDPTLLAHPPGDDRSFGAFLESLPDVLAARDLRTVAGAVAAAARNRRGVVLLLGGHVIKVGLGPLIADWIRRGIVTHVAMNGAAAIHDFELTAFGGTSEDVAAGLEDGTFGMAEETGRDMNAAIAAAARDKLGIGEGLARFIAAMPKRPGDAVSVLLACIDRVSRSRCMPPSAPRSSTSIRRRTGPPWEPRAIGISSDSPAPCPTSIRAGWC